MTPGSEPVIGIEDLRPGLHLNMLGADGPGKAEATVEAVARVHAVLRRVGAGLARRRADRRDRGRPGAPRRRSESSGRCWPATRRGVPAREAVTLFDSTGLAIQDLAVAAAAYAAWQDGAVQAQTVEL